MSCCNVCDGDEEMESSYREIDDETMLLDTGYENGMNFLSVWNSCGSVDKFLTREDYISVRGTTVGLGEAKESLRTECDIDGICIEWLDIGKGMDSNFSHVQLASVDKYIRNIYPMLRKHLNLTKYKNDTLKVLKVSVGSQLMYDGGWETWIGFIPVPALKHVYDGSDMKKFAKANMERIRINFQKELKQLLQQRIATKTLAKNNLNDASKLFVLPDDRQTILLALKRAIDVTDLPDGFETKVFSFRFGEKSVRTVKLPVAEYSAVRDMTVHVGCSITSDEYDLFWSRQGLKEIVGQRGVTTTALSFKECANFQSNLDGRRLDISACLRSVSRVGNIQFVQMYSDLPHRYPNSRFHPVTGSLIMLAGIGNALALGSLYRDAGQYLDEIDNNFEQFREGVCRLEMVLSLSNCGCMQPTITGRDLIEVDRLIELLEQYPLLVPYMKDVKLMDKIQTIGLFLNERLRAAYSARRGSGDNEKVWECYQTELALEKLLWGHPLCSASRIYSINLGPGVECASRCLTDMKGFLCLGNSFACCSSENSLPPLQIFSRNVSVQQQLMNVSGIVNLIGTGSIALGRRVVECLLKDLYTVGRVYCRENEFIVSLKGESSNSFRRIVGRISLNDLISRLKGCTNTRFPMVFGSVMKLLRTNGVDIESTLKNGITGIGLRYFPAFRQHDGNRNNYLTWAHNFGCWVICDLSDINRKTEGEAAEMQELVLSEMEKRKLCHSTQYRVQSSSFPWLKPVLLKVAEKNLTQEEKVQVLTFVSCIALHQMGRYVNFHTLSRLEKSLPISQRVLIALEVQCRFILIGVNTVRLFRLHPSIPRKLGSEMEPKTSGNTVRESGPVEIPVPEEHEYATGRIMEDTHGTEAVEMTEEEPVKHYATSRTSIKWSPQEIAVVGELCNRRGLSLFQKFQAYQKRCLELNIPDRSWPSFKRKLQRIKSTN